MDAKAGCTQLPAMDRCDRLLIAGNPERIHIGAHLLRAAQKLNLEVTLCDVRGAFAAPWPLTQLSWRLCDHKPPRMQAFGGSVVQACRDFQPTWLLTVGLAPLSAAVLAAIGEMGIVRLNYLTDDPWNPAHHSRWLEQALKEYDGIYSPRCANLAELRSHTRATVAYLPFAYDPELHYCQPLLGMEDQNRFQCDVVFFGGADSDRIPYIRALRRAGVNVHLYGGYWNRYADLRLCWKGHADPETLRKAVTGANVTLCLVRRANRDGHVMRTFEAPAMGACMVTEDTAEHRVILGEDNECTLYFRDTVELVERVQWLLAHPSERFRLRDSVHLRITSQGNTYSERLAAMLHAYRPTV